MASPPYNPDQSVPGDSDLISAFPAAERTFRDIVESYLNTDHDATTGRHKYAGLVEQSGNPTNAANLGFLYTKDVGGITEAFYMDHAGTVKQLTNNGKLNVVAADIPVDAVDGTKISVTSETAGVILYFDGTAWVVLAPGTAGQFLRSGGTGAPTWANVVGYEVQKARTEYTTATSGLGGTGGSFAASGLSVTINSVAAGNDVRVRGFLSLTTNVTGVHIGLRVKRDATVLIVGAASSARTQIHSGGNPGANQLQSIPFDILDVNPGAGNYTYSVEVVADQNQTFNVNRTQSDTDANTTFRSVSIMEAIEIKR